VNTSFAKALSIPINDVPILFTNMRDEFDLWAYDYVNITDMNTNEYNNYLENNFAPWNYTGNVSVGTQIAEFYNSTTIQSVNQSYFDFNADFGVFCPNIQLAITAAQSYNSPVYVGVVYQPPETPVQAYPIGYPELVYPFHGWDYMVSSYAWNLFTTMPGYSTGATYHPTAKDLALGKQLQNEIISLMTNGVTSTIKTVNDPSIIGNGFPLNYSLAVIGNEEFSSSISNTKNFKQGVCQFLTNVGLNPDERFWWVN